MPLSGEGKVFLIAGASSGIGGAVARQAANTGFRVVLAARSVEIINKLATELGGSEKALAVRCDTTSWQAQQVMVETTLQQFGRLDVVLSNAAILKGSCSFFKEEATPDEWREMVLTNVYGNALTARAVLPELIKTRGHLLFTGSVVGRVALPGELYSATKLAVDGLGEAIRKELIGTGVRVTVVQPGRVATKFGNPDELPNMPMLSTDDVAQAILYAALQPSHIDVNEIIIRPTGQTM